MFHFELHQQRTAELRRRAEQERLVREALDARRAARRSAAGRSSGTEPDPRDPSRTRFTRAA
ncbi:hypothetical protein [Streptomyces thermoalcalitolerans]|uniref:Uncharacterized protein n=1 Tax=Streptomyces thermoalcalitolerans TaxID=65605 RepID=A0ABN1NQD2_9ACTN